VFRASFTVSVRKSAAILMPAALFVKILIDDFDKITLEDNVEL